MIEGIGPFSLQEVLEAVLKKRTFLQVEARLDLDVPNRKGKVEIVKDSILATTGKERRELENARTGLFRWSAGGLGNFYTFKDARVFVAIHRDMNAPSYRNHDTISSGLAGNVEELIRVDQLAFREGGEECALWLAEGLVVPHLAENEELGTAAMKASVTNFFTIDRIPDAPSAFRERKITPRPARLLAPKDTYAMSVGYEGGENVARYQTLVTVDAGTNGIDFLWLMDIDCSDVSFEGGNFAFVDGEVLGDGKALDRVMNCYEIDDKGRFTGRIVASFQSGKRIKQAEGSFPYPIPPVFQTIVEACS